MARDSCRSLSDTADRRRAAAILTSLLLVIGGLSGCEMPTQTQRDTLTVDLFAPIRAQPELAAWPSDADGELRDIYAVQQPHRIQLRLGGRDFAADSQLSLLKQRAGTLSAVSVQPPEQLREYDAALTALEDVLRAQGLLTPEFATQLMQWRERPPGKEDSAPTRSARARLENFDVFVNLRPQARGGWYYTLEFEHS